MANINLTQIEADTLIAMPKVRLSKKSWDYPGQGYSINIPLVSVDKHENFSLDISRGRIDLLRYKYQNRARSVVVLVRLDLGAPHRNPDGEEIPSPHLHIYREGFGDKWAVLIPKDRFSNTADSDQTLYDFIRYCNISKPPIIRKGFFV